MARKMMAKKKAIIHIGGHKTGTSAIQAFCVLNADSLRQMDIIYPLELVSHIDRIGGQAHHGLVNLFMDATTFWKHINLRPKGITDADIVSYLKSLPRDKNILFSSENLMWFDLESIKAFKEMLSGFDVHVVLYVRRQDDALQALYQTVVVSIGETQKFNDYTSSVVKEVVKYDKIAENWQSIVDVGKVMVRVYEPDQLYCRDTVSDFFQLLAEILQIQVDISSWKHASGTINRGLPAHITGLIRYHNTLVTRKVVVPAIRLMAKWLYKNSRGSYEILSPSERRRLLESFAISNENLARKFLGREDGVLFYDLAIKQTEAEWNQKYNGNGSLLMLLVRDIISKFRVTKPT
ncbi:hypothetical protein [Methyloglobulus morosus]|nr:hypothetical protein [Methyloglobulus morosus]